MKQIAIVIGSLRTGGAENSAMNICRYLPREKYKFYYIVFNHDKSGYEKEARKNGAEIIRIHQDKKHILKGLWEMKHFFQTRKIDAVHVHTLFNSGIWLWMAKKYKIPIRICHSHTTQSGKKEGFFYTIYTKVMRFIVIKNATHLLACGKEAGNYLYGKQLFQKKGKVLKNGIPMESFLYQESKRKKIQKAFGLENKFVVGHVGRLDWVKNHEFLLRIFFELKARKQDAILLLIGDGPLKETILQTIRKLNLEDSIILTGNRQDIDCLLCAMDLFVFPSFFEGFPVTLMEAQASGLPCLVSDTITKEVKLISNLSFLSLHQSASYWAEQGIFLSKKADRNNIPMEAFLPYDVKHFAKELEELYGSYKRKE